MKRTKLCFGAKGGFANKVLKAGVSERIRLKTCHRKRSTGYGNKYKKI